MTDLLTALAKTKSDSANKRWRNSGSLKTTTPPPPWGRCGDPIPEARQRIVSGCRLCVICQTLKEING
ncbi:TraR/DksA C4-type zinc finger protein [Kingella kingae]|uniref:TraR/DksA C4-type zinc finger protein n=1 Tax=Kingella kingae TaxID=504 RepID=UPI000404FD74|nr:TraR/DksA C4-type zinc finger protein [Kingella kingae]